MILKGKLEELSFVDFIIFMPTYEHPRLWQGKVLLPVTTEYTEWQRPLFGVHSIMRVKLAWLVRVGGARPVAHPLSLLLPSPVKLQCTLQLSGQIHWPCFISTNICTLCLWHLKVLTNEKRGGVTVVSFDRFHFKLFSLKFSNKLVQAPSCERPKTTQRTLFLLFANNNCFQITA